jgi:hypothetical protein
MRLRITATHSNFCEAAHAQERVSWPSRLAGGDRCPCRRRLAGGIAVTPRGVGRRDLGAANSSPHERFRRGSAKRAVHVRAHTREGGLERVPAHTRSWPE